MKVSYKIEGNFACKVMPITRDHGFCQSLKNYSKEMERCCGDLRARAHISDDPFKNWTHISDNPSKIGS